MPADSVRIFPNDWLRPLSVPDLFSRPAALEIDLGCGKGRFLLARAAAHPEINFLGIDRMLRRIRKVDAKAVRRRLDNLRLMRMEAFYAAVYLVPVNAVSRYYIFFPDPWPKKRHHKNRLFNEAFMNALAKTLVTQGQLHLATDHQEYFLEIQSQLVCDARFHSIEPYRPGPEERTDFELIFEGRTAIHRCSVEKK